MEVRWIQSRSSFQVKISKKMILKNCYYYQVLVIMTMAPIIIFVYLWKILANFQMKIREKNDSQIKLSPSPSYDEGTNHIYLSLVNFS